MRSYDPYQQNVRRFRLSEVFIDQYRDEEVPWGPVGYITYKRTYARRLDERRGLGRVVSDLSQSYRRNVHNPEETRLYVGFGVERYKSTTNGERSLRPTI